LADFGQALDGVPPDVLAGEVLAPLGERSLGELVVEDGDDSTLVAAACGK
jgi:hypothetical protein